MRNNNRTDVNFCRPYFINKDFLNRIIKNGIPIIGGMLVKKLRCLRHKNLDIEKIVVYSSPVSGKDYEMEK